MSEQSPYSQNDQTNQGGQNVPPVQNPYAAPQAPAAAPAGSINIAYKDQQKVDAVIKDSRQLILAILVCFLCSSIGALIIPIWYFVRLMQWNRLSQQYPALMQPNAPGGSMQEMFQGAKTRFIIGIIFGMVIWTASIAFFILYVVMAP